MKRPDIEAIQERVAKAHAAHPDDIETLLRYISELECRLEQCEDTLERDRNK